MRRDLCCVILCVAIATTLAGCSRNPGNTSYSVNGREQVTIKGKTFSLEMASDSDSRDEGLMGRTEIPAGMGMLFVFPESGMQYFWMGHCLTDMDIIFLDARGHVTATHAMKAQSPQRSDESDDAYRRRMGTYSSGLPAMFAIELPPGSLEELKVRVDDRIDLDTTRLKAMAR
ncbi:MAG TPA: DUF192 domain-containing protein [Phycisphaerales bacterium]|nr:DUF192 domain-containing protein [Phycisphaerales bacterium]